jgi:hypothetical protein
LTKHSSLKAEVRTLDEQQDIEFEQLRKQLREKHTREHRELGKKHERAIQAAKQGHADEKAELMQAEMGSTHARAVMYPH